MGDVEQVAELLLEPQQRGGTHAIHGLQGDETATAAIEGPVHGPHPAAAQDPQDLVAVHLGPGRVDGPARSLVELDAARARLGGGAGSGARAPIPAPRSCRRLVGPPPGASSAPRRSDGPVESATSKLPAVLIAWWTSNWARKRLGVVRESGEILLECRAFSRLFSKDHLVVDQVEEPGGAGAIGAGSSRETPRRPVAPHAPSVPCDPG